MFLFYVNPILIAAAVIPAIVLLRFVYKEDRLDKESPGLLLSLVIFGVLSTFAAIVTEQIGEAILGILLPQSSTAYNVLLYFVVVALSEEGFKYLLLKKRTWYSGEFNCQFDGIVYAVFVALGFALWENISYVVMYGLGTAAIRAVMVCVPLVLCLTVFSLLVRPGLPSLPMELRRRTTPHPLPGCFAALMSAGQARYTSIHR